MKALKELVEFCCKQQEKYKKTVEQYWLRKGLPEEAKKEFIELLLEIDKLRVSSPMPGEIKDIPLNKPVILNIFGDQVHWRLVECDHQWTPISRVSEGIDRWDSRCYKCHILRSSLSISEHSP